MENSNILNEVFVKYRQTNSFEGLNNLDIIVNNIDFFSTRLKKEEMYDLFSFISQKGNFNENIKALEKMCIYFILYFENNKFVLGLAKAYHKLSITKRYYGEYEEAFELVNKAQAIYKELHLSNKVAQTYNSLANIYLDKSEYSFALEYYYKAFSIIRDSDKNDFYFLVKTNLASIYIMLNFYDNALDLYKQDIEQFIVEKNYERLSSIYRGIAEIYFEKNRLILAYKYALRSIEYFNNTSNIRGKIHAFITYGTILQKEKKFEMAINLFETAKSLSDNCEFNIGKIHSNRKLGDVYFELEQFEKSIQLLDYSRELAKKSNLIFELTKINNTLYKSYEKIGNNNMSFFILKELNSLNEEYFNLSLQAKVNEINLKHELEKKDIEFQKERELSEYKNNLFSFIAHEFRTPITLIKTPLDLIKINTEDEFTISKIKDIEIQIKLILKLLNQFLEINQIQEGKMPLINRLGHILPLIWSIIHSFESEMIPKKLKFTYDLPKKDIQLYIDFDKIEKILYNLLSNAIKYTQNNGEIKLKIEYKDSILSITIEDNGYGIPKKFQKDIFNKYYRLPNTDSIVGSGMGLSFVKELVNLLEGEIILDSKYKKGSKFIINIPIKNNHSKEINIEEHYNSSENIETNLNILIVEDNLDLIQILKNLFKSKYKISYATNGKEAMTKIQKNPPDLIISDIMIPIISGIELCQYIKSTKQYSHIPFVILSAKTQIQDKLEGIQSGADAYIFKPFDINEITLTVDSLITQRQKLIDSYSQNLLNVNDHKLVSHEISFIQSVTDFIHSNIENSNLSVNDIAKHMNMSRFTLIRKLKTINDITPNRLIQKIRLEKAKIFLIKRIATISEIGYLVGFSSSTYFTTSFKNEFNITPKDLYNDNTLLDM